MDINSLLSPTSSDAPRAASIGPGASAPSPQSAVQQPYKFVQRTHSGPVIQVGASRTNAASSPLAREILPHPSIPAHIHSPSQRPLNSSPLISPVPTDSSQQPSLMRNTSTPSMDTLADLASMQSHQPVRATPPISKSVSYDSHRTAASAHRPSFDIAMVETPKQLLRGDYAGTSLSVSNQQRLSELVRIVHETPSAFEASLEIIKILHQGLVDHIYPSSSPSAHNDPSSYDLLAELRQAREAADKTFAVGEDLWLDWLQDESILAQTAEERVAVIELCKRAVEEEYGSPRLWQTYGDWTLHCYTWAHEPSKSPAEEEEKLVGREIFQRNDVNTTWEEAVRCTGHDMALSHIVWDKFLRTRFPDFEEKVSDDRAAQILDLFQSRLLVPQAQWEATFQAFSSFVSANFAAQQYEHLMAETLENAAAVKAIWSAREEYEAAVGSAAEEGDKYAEYQCYHEYIGWEKGEAERIAALSKKLRKREPIQDSAASARMIHALYQRAELRLPSVVSIWEDHAAYLAERRDGTRQDKVALELLLRATKHCPWSGSLWQRLLLVSEIADQPFQATESIQQNATKTGMLDAAGTEEVLKVHDAWCGYLLRRTRRPDATEEDADVAEMGIRTSIEAVQSLASKLDGDSNVDASFRLQRKYIEYLKGQGRFDNARKQFDDAASTYGKFYRFWLRFYEFEMQASLHISSLQQDSRDGVNLHSSSPFAVGILKKGLEQPQLDYPEYLIEALINHCEDYEDAEELQSAVMLVDKAQKKLAIRRHQEAEAITEKDDGVPVGITAEQRTEAVAENLHIGKRKREDGENAGDTNKRARNNEAVEESVEEPLHEPPKRDREHASVLVQHVPAGVSESRVRQYFSKCGQVLSLKVIDDDGERSFIVEFQEAAEAQYALSRNEQDFDGAIISVSLNTDSTLYVTNYPAAADEAYLRDLFQPYGEIVSTRFPSLLANKRRRFCYVELKSAAQARAALELDGKAIEGLELTVKISNPAVRKERDTQSQGRTIFVGQLPFKATEKEVKNFFAQYGQIEFMKMPRDPTSASRNKGICFITYSEKASAEAAVQMNDQSFQNRKLKVNVLQDERSRRGKSASDTRSRSLSPTVNVNGGTSSQYPAAPSIANLEEQRSRTVALANIPDTVNEAQIRAVAEKIGTVRKVLLRTQYGGALIELDNAADAGRAAISLDGHEFVSGRHARVVSQEDLKRMQPERKNDKVTDAAVSKKKIAPRNTGSVMAPTAVRRPNLPGAKKGGHLGQRTGLGFRPAPSRAQADGNKSTENKSEGEGEGNGTAKKKSNDDFRAMLDKSNGVALPSIAQDGPANKPPEEP